MMSFIPTWRARVQCSRKRFGEKSRKTGKTTSAMSGLPVKKTPKRPASVMSRSHLGVENRRRGVANSELIAEAHSP
jgi:hypothetical protein